MSTRQSVAVVGVSGFSGLELARLVARHPALELVAAVADRWASSPLGARVPGLPREAARLVVRPMRELDDALRDVRFVCLATPAEASLELAPKLLERGHRVLDLSGAFRLADVELFRAVYRLEPPPASLQRAARYGLPELEGVAGDAPPYETVALLSNPGCYATAAILALAPLVTRGLVALDGIFVDGKSGVSGAGRKTEERLLFMEIDENVSAYRVGDHQHAPEIEQALSRLAGAPVRLTFVPHLLPVRRGLSVTAFARLAPSALERARREPDLRELEAALEAAYDDAELVRVVRPEEVSLAAVAHTPLAQVAHRLLPERGSAVALASLDNLLKGAASQALQNLCRMASVPFEPGAPT